MQMAVAGEVPGHIFRAYFPRDSAPQRVVQVGNDTFLRNGGTSANASWDATTIGVRRSVGQTSVQVTFQIKAGAGWRLFE